MKQARHIVAQVLKRRRFRNLEKQNIHIHPDSHIGRHTFIGTGTRINGPAYIDSREDSPVRIGKYCAIAYNLRVRTGNHSVNHPHVLGDENGFPPVRTTKGGVTIGNSVWIGDNVVVLSGVTIGNGAVIGAGSVVTKDVRKYAIAAGVPARELRLRFVPSIVQQLEQIQWWNWTEERIARNTSFFSLDLCNMTEIGPSVLVP